MRNNEILLTFAMLLGTSVYPLCQGTNASAVKAAISITKGTESLENLCILHFNEEWRVGTISTRDGPDSMGATVFALHRTKNGWVRTLLKEFEGAYNARMELSRTLTYNKQPLVMVKIQFGAAVESMEVFSLSGNKFRHLQSLSAGTFFWSTTSIEAQPTLIGYPPAIDMQETRFHWNGRQFAQDLPSPTK